MERKRNKHNFLCFIARILFTFLMLGIISLGINYWFFPLSERIELNYRNRFKIAERISFKSKSSLKSAIANGFQTSLNLAWYDVHFENHNHQGILYLGISDTCTNKTLKTTDENLKPSFNYFVNPAGNGICTISVEDESSLKRMVVWGMGSPLPANYEFSMSMIDIYATPNIYAWLAKFIIIFLIMANTLGSLGIVSWFYLRALPWIFEYFYSIKIFSLPEFLFGLYEKYLKVLKWK